MCKKLRKRSKMRFRSCRNLDPAALGICAIVRKNARETALSRENSAPVVRKFGSGRFRNFCDRAKNCADVRKNERASGNPAPVVRKLGPGRFRNLRDCAKKKTVRTCEKLRERAEIRPRSRENPAPFALEICGVSRKKLRGCSGNCARVRKSGPSRAKIRTRPC